KLTDWLCSDALLFEFLFVAEGQAHPLEQEAELLAMLFREQIANGTLCLGRVPSLAAAGAEATARARRSECDVLTVAVAPAGLTVEGAEDCQLILAGPRPRLVTRTAELPMEGDDALESWQAALAKLIPMWL